MECHHIDGNASNNKLNNLTSLCKACHFICHCGRSGRKDFTILAVSQLSQKEIVKRYHQYAVENEFAVARINDIDPKATLL